MLESRVKDLEKQLSREQEDFLEKLAQKDQDFQSLQESLTELTGEYSELLAHNVVSSTPRQQRDFNSQL
jgi:uncharacterized coiled-coil protein SlyX